MDGKVGKILKYILLLAVAAVLLFFAFRKIEWDEFWSALKACRWSGVVLSMLIGILAFFFRALRWRQLLLPVDASTSRLTCFNAINISYMVNLVLPRVGEFVRCGFITARSAKDPDAPEGEPRRLATYDKVLGTAALDRTADVLALGIFLCAFLLFTWKRFGAFFMDKIFLSASGTVSAVKVIVLCALALLAAAGLFLVIRFSDRWAPLKKVSGFCKGLWEGFLSCLKMKNAWWFFVLTVLIWVCYWFMSASVLWAIQGISPDAVAPAMAASVESLRGLGLVDALFLMLAGSLASVVPVPGGFGAFHFIVGGAISTVYGVPFEFGIIFATLSHESQTICQALCGGLSYLSESTRKQ